MKTIHLGLHGGVCYNFQSSYICACQDGSFRSQCLPKEDNQLQYSKEGRDHERTNCLIGDFF
jgi:hypothetical protein